MASKYWFAKHPDGVLLQGSKAKAVSAITDGQARTIEIDVVGARMGDFVLCSTDKDIADIAITGCVTKNDTVTVTLSNCTGGDLTPDASATYHALVIPKATYAS